MFKSRFKVKETTTVVYDTYKQGSYIRNRTVEIPEGTIVEGEKLLKGTQEIVSFNAKQLGVDELVQIPFEKVEKLFPWKLILSIAIPVIIIVSVIVSRKNQ
jgi:hypothetical protein